MNRLTTNFIIFYKRLLEHHPLKVQCLQTALIMSAGDVIAQGIIERKLITDYDILRTLRFTVIGGAIGPSLYIWYSILDKFVGKSGGTVNMNVHKWDKPIVKVAIDQAIFAPVFLAVFISTNSILEGKTVDEIKARLKELYPDLLLANYKLWPCVQIINFSIIPLSYRVLFVQSIALAWNTYLAWRLNVNKNDIKLT